MEKVTVIGVGRLGICLALHLEGFGYDVLGVDAYLPQVEAINSKGLKSQEPEVEDRFAFC